MSRPADNLLGIAAMSAAVFLFFINDTSMKLAAATLPIGEIFFVRGILASTLVGVVVGLSGMWRLLPRLLNGRIAIRLFGEVVSAILYMAGFILMSVADATALFQVTPLATTAAAAIFLKEQVGWRRWLAVAAGFIGVLIILRPGTAGFSPAALYILGAVAFVLVRDLATVGIPKEIPTLLVTGTSSVTLMLIGPLMLPIEPLVSTQPVWDWPGTLASLYIAVSAVTMLVGYLLLTFAFRTAEMSVVAPFRYTVLIWSFLAAIFLFGQTPDVLTFVGAAIVVASGAYTFHRERLRRRAIAAQAAVAATEP